MPLRISVSHCMLFIVNASEEHFAVLNVRIWGEYRDSPLTSTDVMQLADKISGVIYCQNDVLQPENLEQYRSLLVSTKHHLLAGCAHFPWEENPVDYYELILSLMDGHRK